MTVDGSAVATFLAAPWTGEVVAATRRGFTMVVRRGGATAATVEVERCSRGHLRDVYPVANHDNEVRIAEVDPPEVLSSILGAVTAAVRRADPACRKVVYVVDGDAGEAAAAGFRHVVDVEVDGRDVGLAVHEPDWVTRGDTKLDDVPGT